MPMLTSNGGQPLLSPAQVHALLILPMLEESVCAQVCTVIHIGSHEFRMPVLAEDPSAAWTEEGAEIAESSAQVREAIVVPRAIKGLTLCSSELANDTSPEAAAVIGAGLARNIAVRLDEAFFGTVAPPAPAGLPSLVGVDVDNVWTTPAPAEFTNIDPFQEAMSEADGRGAPITSWIAHPTDALALANLKSGSGSNVPLLQPDVSLPTRRAIAGVPLLTSSAVQEGHVWGIPASRVFLVVRQDAEVVTSTDAYFSRDIVAVRAVCRAAYGFPAPHAIAQIVRATP